MSSTQSRARLIALLLPLLLLAGAWGSQLIGGLVPCEMCHWQRWPHYAAVLVAAFAFIVPGRSSKVTMIVAAALLVAVSGLIGVFHAGVEYHWWQGITACSTMATGDGVSTDEMLRRLLAAPVIRCDSAQWTLLGVSLAGYNAILSLGGAAVILWLIGRRAR
ncbi:disulfide bond formation protein B [Sphingomonas sp. IC-11]|uniref:disulfide bond formation protein B n=1 Tax=Sphingomonas sp. IC-11 TaxID=2898528 RepID=UPI001E5779E5|nr:disulfide bond formation protein B [Sphingomonas sp. IC-11]